MKLDNLTKLCIEQLKDIYSAETQLTRALPKMAKSATDTTLKTVRTFAQRLGHTEIAHLLQQTLDEEYATDQKLTTIAAADPGVNEQAQLAAEKEK